jgi:demethylmenaquinone methyltransferase/2-methoxy-6-polyprenyl-1,4-benzoquinol methylase
MSRGLGYRPAMISQEDTLQEETLNKSPEGRPKDHMAGETADFGFRLVERADKARLVKGVFDSVAARYDLMNDLMSAGVHRLWKAALIDQLKPRPSMRLLDVAGGTGDIALRFLEHGGRDVTVCDINAEMVLAGRDRAIDKGVLGGVQWSVGDAQSLPVPDNAFDAYTIAFGLRNVTDIDAALAEARRVLKPGGRFLCLEFSQVALPGLATLYDRYSYDIVPKLGRWVARDEGAYVYLIESIRRFPDQATLLARLSAAGLARARVQNLSGGIVAIHSAWRI